MQPETHSLYQPRRVSVFENLVTTTPVDQSESVSAITDLIRSEFIKQNTETYRSATDTTQAETYKDKAFLGVTWSGIFTPVRSSQNLQQHSGLIAAHLCDLQADRLSELRQHLQDDRYSCLVFSDLSGRGLVAVFRVGAQSGNDHVAFARQLTDYLREVYGIITNELDTSSLEVDWVCAIPHDHEVYFQLDGPVFALQDAYKTPLEQSISQEIPPLETFLEENYDAAYSQTASPNDDSAEQYNEEDEYYEVKIDGFVQNNFRQLSDNEDFAEGTIEAPVPTSPEEPSEQPASTPDNAIPEVNSEVETSLADQVIESSHIPHENESTDDSYEVIIDSFDPEAYKQTRADTNQQDSQDDPQEATAQGEQTNGTDANESKHKAEEKPHEERTDMQAGFLQRLLDKEQAVRDASTKNIVFNVNYEIDFYAASAQLGSPATSRRSLKSTLATGLRS